MRCGVVGLIGRAVNALACGEQLLMDQDLLKHCFTRPCRQMPDSAANGRPAVSLFMRTAAAKVFDDSFKLAYICVLDNFGKQLR